MGRPAGAVVATARRHLELYQGPRDRTLRHLRRLPVGPVREPRPGRRRQRPVVTVTADLRDTPALHLVHEPDTGSRQGRLQRRAVPVQTMERPPRRPTPPWLRLLQLHAPDTMTACPFTGCLDTATELVTVEVAGHPRPITTTIEVCPFHLRQMQGPLRPHVRRVQPSQTRRPRRQGGPGPQGVEAGTPTGRGPLVSRAVGRPRHYDEDERAATTARLTRDSMRRLDAEGRRRALGRNRLLQWAVDDWLDVMEGAPIDGCSGDEIRRT